VSASETDAIPCQVIKKMTRQGLRALRPTRPAGSVDDLAELDKATRTGPIRHGTTAWTLYSALSVGETPSDSGKANARVCYKVLAGRKPLLLLRFSGWFLLRLAERTFDA